MRKPLRETGTEGCLLAAPQQLWGYSHHSQAALETTWRSSKASVTVKKHRRAHRKHGFGEGDEFSLGWVEIEGLKGQVCGAVSGQPGV